MLSTYPIAGADTGGPLRVKAIYEMYKKHVRHVKHVAIFSGHHHPTGYAASDIMLEGKLADALEHAHNHGDYLIGKGIYEDDALRQRVLDLLLSYRPDIIEIEQVFPYIGLRHLLKELPFAPKLVHSSHNIEYPMKDEILAMTHFPIAERKAIVATVREAEEELTKKADLVVVVTKADGERSLAMGAKKYSVARNGVFAISASETAKQYWQHYFEKHEIDRAAIFIGSAHPPNIFGFKQMIGYGMGFLPAQHKIILAGDVGTNLMSNLDEEDVAAQTAHRRLLSVGRLPQDLLNGLIVAAHTILLPITEGGGSNLKTAEAIVAGKHIVATTKALRSFEEYQSLPNMNVHDAPNDFRAAIAASLDLPAISLPTKTAEETQKVLWGHCLTPMLEGVKAL